MNVPDTSPMSLASQFRRWATIVVAVAAVIWLAAVMAFVYRGRVANLNAVDMLEHPVRSDFALYYRDSKVALQSPQHNPYDLATFRQVTAQFGIKRLKADPVVPSLSLPPLIWLVMPFTLLPLDVARWLWLGLLVSCLAMVWTLTAPGKGLTKIAHLAAAVIFLPVSFALADGQAILLVAAAVAISWSLLRRGHEVWAGIVLSLLLLKPQIAFLVPVALLVAGRWKGFISFVGAVSAFGVVALVTIPWNALLQYTSRLTQASGDPSLWSVNMNLPAASQGGAIVGLAESGVAAAVAVVAIRRVNGHAIRDDIAVVGGLLVSLLATPYLHYPDLTILLAAAWVFLRTTPPIWQRWLLFAGYGVATMEPVGVALTRTVEMVWLVCLVQPPSPSLVWQAVRAAFQRVNPQPSRAG